MKRADQIVIERILIFGHALHASGVVNVIYRTQAVAFVRFDLVHVKHEWRRMTVREVFALVLSENRRREGTEPFAVFNPGIERVFHCWQSRMRENRSVSERARSPF